MPTSPYCLTIYSNSSYLGPVGVASGGIRAHTHLARIMTANGPRRCYIKGFPNANNRLLINEIVGYTLAHHASVPQPEGGLIALPIATLEQIFKNSGRWAATAENDLAWCFVSMEAQNIYTKSSGVAAAIFHSKNLSQLGASLRRWKKLPAAIAFDTWIANVDRHGGNVMMIGPDEYQVIDHSDILTGPAWTVAQLIAGSWYTNRLLDEIVTPETLALPTKNAIVKSAQDFVKAYVRAKPELDIWLKAQSGTIDYPTAQSFIETRATLSEALLADRVQVIR